LQARINETRAAGIQASLVARYVFFKPRLVLTAGGLNAASKVKLIEQVIGALQAHVDTLKAGDAAQGQQMVRAIVSKVPQVKGAKGIRFADVMAWRSDVSKSGSNTVVDDVLKAVASTPAGDLASLRVAVQDAVSPAFSERRIPDRALILGATLGATKQPATDQQIQDGLFQVSSLVGGAKYALALDLQPTDIMVTES
jgi:hypothetical protein